MSDTPGFFSPETLDNPYPFYAQLREHAPVFKVDPPGFWILTRFDDVLYALRTPEVFSSRIPLGMMRAGLDPRLNDEAGNILFSGTTLVSVDPPAHTRMRKLVTGAFSPKAIARMEGRIRELARGFIDDLMKCDSFDLMESLAVPLPVTVIAEMLGVDPAQRSDFKRWSDDLLAGRAFGQVLPDAEVERVRRSRQALIDFFRTLIAVRRVEPRDDLISELVRAEVEHEVLTPEEVLGMAVLLLVAGNETTTNLIGNATTILMDRPEDLARLRAEPALIPMFLEEVLRYRSPVIMVVRTAAEDVTLRGVTIPKGQIVNLLVDSANHDPAAFPDPERFDLTRQPQHVAFGYGIHFCLGATLSRLEGRIVFEELVARLPAFSRAAPAEWSPHPFLRGLRTLKLKFDRG